jgi:hypothetical protein
MPRRTNTFQKIIAIVSNHMAHGAKVEESAMVTPIRGGDPREVDVLIRSTVAGHDICVGIEACKSKRTATVQWVEEMIGKHNDLPTDKVVLYSGSGFTKRAQQKAAEHGITTIGAEELSEDELEQCVLNGLRSIWPKRLSLTPEGARVWVHLPGGQVAWFKAPPFLALFLEDGTEAGLLKEVVMGSIRAQWNRVVEQIGLCDIAESTNRTFRILWHRCSIRAGGMEKRLHARKADICPPELHPIERLEVTGRAIIEVQEVTLSHMRLAEVLVAYGELELAGRRGVVVASKSSGEELLTIRL